MAINMNHMGTSSDNKLVREMIRIIKEDEENVRQSGKSDKRKYKAVSRDGDTLEISADHYMR